MFRFHNPDALYLLLLLPALIALFIYVLRDRKRRLEKFGNIETLSELMPEVSLPRVKYKFSLIVLATALLIIALARPQAGAKLKEVSREGVEIMIAVDVSNSMLAEDFQPNRLERTKFALNKLLDGLSEDKVGVIVFAGDAYVQLPITSDYTTARTFVSQISTDIVSKQGTAIGSAIDLASRSFSSQSEGSRVMILITDGENHEDNAVAAAEAAAAKGINIYTIGMGTPEGAPLEIDGDFIRDDKGEMVVSKLDEEVLEKIAMLSDGAYIRSNNKSIGLDEIIAKINETKTAEFKAEVFEEFNENFQYPLAIAILLLMAEFYLLERKNRLLAKFNIFSRSKRV